MISNTITYCSGNSFFERQFFKLKIRSCIKECEQIKETLRKKKEFTKEDIKINVIIPSSQSETSGEVYFIHRGYNRDGSIKSVRKYKLSEGKVIEEEGRIDKKIAVLDLYEKSIYLYNYILDEEYATGYIMKVEKYDKSSVNMIFSLEKVKVLLKNVNIYYQYSTVDDFLDMFFF